METRSAKQRRLSGLRGKLTKYRNMRDSFKAKGIFIGFTAEIKETEWRIAMLEEELAADAVKT